MKAPPSYCRVIIDDKVKPLNATCLPPFFFGLPFHGRCIRVLHFEPIEGVAGTAQRKFTRA
jgi:hypothetical protein